MLAPMTACTGGGEPTVVGPPAAAPSPPKPHGPEDQAVEQALRVYERYWRISEEAAASPRGVDWPTELAKVMADPALSAYIGELANLASVPAHSRGQYGRSPKVTTVALAPPPRVVVIDCLDATNEHLISEKPGDGGRSLDHPDQPKRYEFEAQIVRYPNPDRWLVQQVQARLEKPC
ncbi:hypothetical protein ABZ342_00360 [Amycolatopsis sp. NPDC005961]|uniref:hypothetical protein n=1 Tax=Amycolatopsis sp. NPDC005961 TaxID=3156720 RepID=UPI0033FC0CB8